MTRSAGTPNPDRDGRHGADMHDLDGIEALPTIAWAPLLGRMTSSDGPVPSEIIDRRRAVRDLGRAIRALGNASLMTEVSTAGLSHYRTGAPGRFDPAEGGSGD